MFGFGKSKFSSACVCCEPGSGSGEGRLDRRSFLATGAAALSLGVAAPGIISPARAQAPAAAPVKRRIDVHHHVVPPMQAAAFTARNSRPPRWSVNASLEDMDKGGVQTSIVSIINPGVWFGEVSEASRKLARECNEYCAQLGRDHPGRFGFFAAIPLPDVEGSLKEIEYALDVLKADGIALWTMYTPGKYLGDAAFLPVFEELNRRKAVVYTHPTVPDCCSGVADMPPSAIEYATDTTRTVGNLIFGKAGTAFKTQDMRWIWSHSGGTIPFLTSRFVRLAWERKMENGPMPILQKYFYEVAQGNTPGQFDALMRMVSISQVMFGSDYPYRDATEAVDGLAAYDKFTEADRRAIDFENAQKMFPRWKAG